MKITEVRISPAKGGKVRAFAGIVIDDCFVVNDLRVMEGREGQLFVTMPARKTRNGQLRDTAHPLNTETRRLVEERVLEEYRQAVTNVSVPKRASSGGRSRKREKLSVMDRLAGRLFNEEFWSPDEARQETDET